MPRYGDLEKIEKELTEIILDYLRDGSIQCNIAAGVACDIRDTVINNAPTADVENVVYCKDCKYAAILKFSFGGEAIGCEILHRDRKESDYCSYGERRNDENS